MLYEMLCGTLPFGARDPNAVMAQIIYGSPTPLEEHLPWVPRDLRDVVHRALERDLGRRFATMADFRAALAACELWRGVTPAMAEGMLPRPSALEGVDELLPSEFREPAPAEALPDEDRLPTHHLPRRPAPPPDTEPARAHRRHADVPTSLAGASVGSRLPRGVVGVALVLTLLCAAVLVLGAVHWAGRPSAEVVTPSNGRVALARP